MAPLALFLKKAGFSVSGSDSDIYPPMSERLKERGIAAQKYSGAGISSRIKLAIVGNAARRDNEEAAALREKNIPYISFPEFLEQAFLSKSKNIVVAGTHGKSTTAALAAFAARAAGQNPGFFIGALSPHFENSFYFPPSPNSSPNLSPWFILEGDEYDSAFFLKRPKFFFYNPLALILTGIEFDHGDIYKDIEEIKEVFKTLIKKIPAEGRLIVCAENPLAMEAASLCRAPVISYGLNSGDFQIKNRRFEQNAKNPLSAGNGGAAPQTGKQLFDIHHKGKKRPCGISLLGEHNALNAAAVFALAQSLSWPLDKVLEALGNFRGVQRRLQKRGEFQGPLLFEDFAHHPTEAKASLLGLREAYPKRRLIALFEPRSFTSRLNVFQKEYVSALKEADIILVARPFRPNSVPEERRLSSEKLAADLAKEGRLAFCEERPEDMARRALSLARAEDLIVVMSNGSFGGILEKLEAGLRKFGKLGGPFALCLFFALCLSFFSASLPAFIQDSTLA